MVYIGGRIDIFIGGNMLFVATYEVVTRNLASVCNRGQCVLLLRRAVWLYNCFIKKSCGWGAQIDIMYIKDMPKINHRLISAFLFF